VVNQRIKGKSSGLLRVGEAAEFKGIFAETLCNWDRAGRLVPIRNPVTGYRYYDKNGLAVFRERIVKERDDG
jgi:DNA-binding transcriptional MerR regulator